MSDECCPLFVTHHSTLRRKKQGSCPLWRSAKRVERADFQTAQLALHRRREAVAQATTVKARIDRKSGPVLQRRAPKVRPIQWERRIGSG